MILHETASGKKSLRLTVVSRLEMSNKLIKKEGKKGRKARKKERKEEASTTRRKNTGDN